MAYTYIALLWEVHIIIGYFMFWEEGTDHNDCEKFKPQLWLHKFDKKIYINFKSF